MRWWLLVVAFVVSGCPRDVRPEAPPPTPLELTLFITSELKGYLGPCGCSENMRGGIARAAYQLEAVRQTGRQVVFVDTGNTLFGQPAIEAEAIAQQERKARALTEALRAMGLAAKANGPLDDVRGAAFRQGLRLPEFASNAVWKVPLDASRTLAVVSSGSVDELVTRARQARASGASFVLALFEGPMASALPLGQRDDLEADLLVATRGKDELAGETNTLAPFRVPVVQVQSKGRSLLRVDLFLKGPGRVTWLKSPTETQRELDALAQRIELLRAQVNDPSMDEGLRALKRAKLEEIVARREALASEPVPVPGEVSAASVRFVPLETSFPSSPSVQALVAAYDRDVGELNVQWARSNDPQCEKAAPAQASYVGSATCRGCHAQAFPLWEASKHARSYPTLVEQGKNNHLDCVACHVTGWKEPGGTCRVDRVTGFDAVGCESCHGAGSLHVADGSPRSIVRASGAVMCVGCHDRENSPHFSLEKYLPRVLGPGHGAPAPPPPDAGAPAPPPARRR
ncbi:MAG: cytochrome c family protein [Myxococcaceae bacterium]|nr:cytochrome c family protein [Myxococcaceae bacterium]